MTKTRLVETIIILSSLGVAVRLSFDLAGRGVAVMAISTVVFSTLASGFFLAAKIGDAATVEIFKCDTPGCPALIRAQHVSTEEARHLRSLAADHARHGDGA